MLYLNSYHAGYKWSDSLVAGMRSVLDTRPYPVELWVEHMDTRRFDGDEYLPPFTQLLRVKHGRRRFDALVAADDAALRFLLDRRGDLFAGVPVVFMGINDATLAARADPRLHTGVREVVPTDDVIRLAIQLRPSTRRVIVVSDATPASAVQQSAYAHAAQAHRGVEFVYLDAATLPLERILEALAALSASDAVMTSSFTRDVTGRYFSPATAVAQIVAASKAPVYSLAVSELGQGLLAGAKNGGYRHARRAGEMLVRILDGATPSQIPREQEGEAELPH